MTVNNPESLGAQLTDAMRKRLGDGVAESVFKHDLWPVLEAAMKNGELLVSRNTAPRIPVHEAVVGWLEGVLVVMRRVKADQATISRGKLLSMVLQLGEIGEQALKDSQAQDPMNAIRAKGTRH
jgi:hypothetical protein